MHDDGGAPEQQQKQDKTGRCKSRWPNVGVAFVAGASHRITAEYGY